MADEIEDIARLLGAKVVGQVPDVGGGAPAAAYLAKVYQARMEQLQKQPTGQAAQTSDRILEVPVSVPVAQALAEIAEICNRAGQRVALTEIAAGLLSGAALHSAEIGRQLESQLEKAEAQVGEAELRCAELKAEWKRAEQAFRRALLEMSGVSDRQAAG